MAKKRRKKLKRKLLTYDEITRRIERAYKKDKKAGLVAALYGNVKARVTDSDCNWYEIGWYGSVRQKGKYSPEPVSVPFARVFALSDGETGYVVMPVQRARKGNALDAAKVKAWKQYVGSFTPHDPTQRLFRTAVGYRVRDGVVAGGLDIRMVTVTYQSQPFPVRCWQAMSPVNQPKPSVWVGDRFRTFPKFISRSRRFVNDLRAAFKDGPEVIIQLLVGVGRGIGHAEGGLILHICTPPSPTQDGRRLIVQASMHNEESRKFFHIDGDYSPRHSQYFAWEAGIGHRGGTPMRWKCGKEALAGIKEWVLGSIYIPGPE